MLSKWQRAELRLALGALVPRGLSKTSTGHQQPRSSELEVFNAHIDVCTKVLQILMIMKKLKGLELLQGLDYRQDLKDIMILGP